MKLVSKKPILCLVALVGGCAQAQVSAVNGPGTPATISGKGFRLSGFAMYTQGEPFQLVQRHANTLTLPDGTKRTSETVDQVFRDSRGRFRLESGSMKDGVFEARNITIFDPVALVEVSFGAHATTGRLTHIEPRQFPSPEDERKAAEQAARSAAYDRAHPDDFSEEALGTRTIAGEEAVGTRKKQLFVPVDGKGRFSRSTETWSSPELKIDLLTVTDNSTIGSMRTEVTDLKRAEPDPELFKVPAGLTLQEQVRH
jgi:hypothetical protein